MSVVLCLFVVVVVVVVVVVGQVSVVRCRQVTKPGGAKPGLVHLNGDILTVKIDVKAETKRGERLEKDRLQ